MTRRSSMSGIRAPYLSANSEMVDFCFGIQVFLGNGASLQRMERCQALAKFL